ncbi:MAG TPA: hypothetical protein GXX72_02780 [Clostridiaceae bacterium]|nr:hypothetical protein [Clostridiaceae bacterium]
MNYAVIDVGSNSVRTSVYDVNDNGFKPLFSKKVQVGLTAYIKSRQLSQEGISRLCSTLIGFQTLLEQVGVIATGVFATAPLRNINNSETVLDLVRRKTGYSMDVLDGESEAMLDYCGILHNMDSPHGTLYDIGGGSTEIVAFKENKPYLIKSIPLGSLSLYIKHVSDFLPTEKEQRHINKKIKNELKSVRFSRIPNAENIVGVGGSARGVVKLINALYKLPPDNMLITEEQLNRLFSIVAKGDHFARTLILRNCPDRIHTIVPGLMVMLQIIDNLRGSDIIISKYGVREGYLCQKMINC